MKQLGPLIWPCLEREREDVKERKKKKERKNENEFKDDIKSLNGSKTKRRPIQKLEESC